MGAGKTRQGRAETAIFHPGYRSRDQFEGEKKIGSRGTRKAEIRFHMTTERWERNSGLNPL